MIERECMLREKMALRMAREKEAAKKHSYVGTKSWLKWERSKRKGYNRSAEFKRIWPIRQLSVPPMVEAWMICLRYGIPWNGSSLSGNPW